MKRTKDVEKILRKQIDNLEPSMETVESLTDTIIRKDNINPLFVADYIDALDMLYQDFFDAINYYSQGVDEHDYYELMTIKENIQKLCEKEAELVISNEEEIKDESADNIVRLATNILSANTSENTIKAKKILFNICKERKKEVEEQIYLEDMNDIEKYDQLERKMRESFISEQEKLEVKSKKTLQILEKSKKYIKK